MVPGTGTEPLTKPVEALRKVMPFFMPLRGKVLDEPGSVGSLWNTLVQVAPPSEVWYRPTAWEPAPAPRSARARPVEASTNWRKALPKGTGLTDQLLPSEVR